MPLKERWLEAPSVVKSTIRESRRTVPLGLQRGTDASEGDMAGGSNCHQVKRKKVKKEALSWRQRGTDSESYQVEHKRVEKGGVCGLQRGTAAFEGDMSGGSDRPRVKRERVKKEPSSRFSRLYAAVKKVYLQHAKMALEFYEKSQDAEFEILEVLYSRGLRLRLPESVSSELWDHVSFIAKPKNDDCIDVSTKYFFGELFRDDLSGKFHATYCSTFEPSEDPGFNHGCILSLPDQKFHPANGFYVGRPPWYKQKRAAGNDDEPRSNVEKILKRRRRFSLASDTQEESQARA